METVLFASEEKKDIHAVADFLRLLADKLDQQTIILRRGAEELRLELPTTLTLELKVEEKVKPTQTKRQFEVELEWVEGGDQSADEVVLT